MSLATVREGASPKRGRGAKEEPSLDQMLMLLSLPEKEGRCTKGRANLLKEVTTVMKPQVLVPAPL